MQTLWGEIAVSDAHVHFFSRSFFTALAAERGRTLHELGTLLGWQIPESDAALAASWVAQLDAAGVTRGALIASIPGDEASVATAVSLHPDRFYGYFMVNPLADGCAERVRDGLCGGRLRGVCLFPAMHRYSIQDARVRPVLEAAAESPAAVVFVHCGVLTVGVRRKLGLPSRFDMRFSNPIDLHAVALEFANINFVVPHFGAGYFREALMLGDLCPNVYLDTSSTNSWIRYQPGAIDLKTVFRKALDVVGPRRLLFGSDSSFFPRGWHAQIFATQTAVLRDLDTSTEDARLILGGNVDRLLESSARK